LIVSYNILNFDSIRLKFDIIFKNFHSIFPNIGVI